jgi:hypothetical protein
MQLYRQGDVLIVAEKHLPLEAARRVRREGWALVLAYGEATGHSHAILDRGAELYELEGVEDRFLRVLEEGGVTLTHQEHAPLVLPKGDYRVRTQREYSPEAIRRVAD